MDLNRNALVRILAQCSAEDSETALHAALVEAYAVTEDEIEANAPQPVSCSAGC